MSTLPISLYHGTSTLFLSGIIESGLGGKNPIGDWDVHTFAKAIFPLVQEHISNDEGWMVKAQSFGFMVNQLSASMNFQHGNTYLSPSMQTAIRYAVQKRVGSELLSYSLDFLEELLKRKVPGVVDELYRDFPRIFGLLDIRCAPLLIEVRHVEHKALVDEYGGEPDQNIAQINEVLALEKENADLLLQQVNFRLRYSVPLRDLTFRLIEVTDWNPYRPNYALRSLHIPGAWNNGTSG